MEKVLRKLAEWKGRKRGAQVIVFDGGAEVERTRSFMKGVFAGAGVAMIAIVLAGPSAMDPALKDEIERREMLLRESASRAEQALQVADVCLSTAQNLERTLATYQQFLGGNQVGRGLSALDGLSQSD